ncbi:hypothetical protein AL509_28415 [Achromobacter xylosoxidans]|uniref:hypothetical protein n=1 Tax=Alcaligenes xylosoxydans xylosoxydans TaxID=85698 RepID=UPI00076B24FA|nr:hypothetical protein [Achromobacter xylosoxidans]AMH07256.1 hypothetical protein AL509_28415 [Achromobacter xylosoxidans]
MSDLERFVEPIAGFATKPAPYIVEVFAWYLHEVKQKARFQTTDIGPCFDEVHIKRPMNISLILTRLCQKTPPRLIKDAKGFRLHHAARKELSVKLPQRATAVATTALLNDLLARVTDPAQKTFLTETLNCFKHHAYRAAVVMAWNLAFSDILDRILTKHLAAFNTGVGTHNLKKPITDRVDFEKLKESEVIKIAAAAGILGKESVKKLEEKLGKRNTAAHPSTVVVSVATAEEVIFDLVENIVLRLNL